MHPYNISGRSKDFMFIRCLNCFQLTFEDRILVQVVPVPGHRLLNLIHEIVIVHLEVSRFTFICLVCVCGGGG